MDGQIAEEDFGLKSKRSGDTMGGVPVRDRPSAPTFSSSSSRGRFSSSICCRSSRHRRVPSSTRDRARDRLHRAASAGSQGTPGRLTGRGWASVSTMGHPITS
ncbi:uncharacterized protein M6B38_285140 [Iris pallida]|uniref:Uncharacterized protein n=1 Tax=Iris pallida TaxID=29817 RepID=A0AAX6I2K1_IRIPA|nr:uncharacterized protein M6B38_285140 [Iris pallida]